MHDIENKIMLIGGLVLRCGSPMEPARSQLVQTILATVIQCVYCLSSRWLVPPFATPCVCVCDSDDSSSYNNIKNTKKNKKKYNKI